MCGLCCFCRLEISGAAGGLFAGKPRSYRNTSISGPHGPVGARLAREGVSTGNKKPADDYSSAGSFITGLFTPDAHASAPVAARASTDKVPSAALRNKRLRGSASRSDSCALADQRVVTDLALHQQQVATVLRQGQCILSGFGQQQINLAQAEQLGHPGSGPVAIAG